MRSGVTRYRAVFVSDWHLGSVGCKHEDLHNFLWSFETDHLYLVGDIIDGWVGRGSAKWTQECNNIVRTVLGKVKHGTQVYYTPGNHDAFLRRVNGSELGNIQVDHSFVHTTADGRELLVVHGDLFDTTVTKYVPVAWAGAWIHEYMTILNAHINDSFRKQRRPVDFASSIKLAVKRLIWRKDDFEVSLLEYAKENGCQGVVCGHIHRPEINQHPDGRIYINCGDWVQNCTAVVEELDGTIKMLKWNDMKQLVPVATPRPLRSKRLASILKR